MKSIAAFEGLLRNVRYAWRVLQRNPGYALLAILTLGLGIGADTAIFTVINGVLLRPLPYAHAEQIVHLDQTAAKLGPDPLGLSVQEMRDFRDQNHVFSAVAEYHSMTFTLLGSKDPERVVTGVVSGNYFDVLGVKPLLGRLRRDMRDAFQLLVRLCFHVRFDFFLGFCERHKRRDAGRGVRP